jgi:hypothetical protein
MKKFLKNFDYWKALPSLITLILLGAMVSVVHGQHMIWWVILASLPVIYLLSCIKTQFEKNLESLSQSIAQATEETDPIKQAMKLTMVCMKNVNRCAAIAMYGQESERHHWWSQARFYENLRKMHREGLDDLMKEQNENKPTIE